MGSHSWMRYSRATVYVSLAWLAGCTSSPPAEFNAEPLDVLHTMEVVAIPQSLSIDEEDGLDANIRIGDCVAYSLQLRTPEATRSWFVRATIAAHRPSSGGSGGFTLSENQRIDLSFTGLVRFHVLVTDSGGTPLGESFTDPVATEVLREGFAPVCGFCSSRPGMAPEELYQRLGDLPPATRRPIVVSALAMTTVLTLILDCEPLAPLLAEAVRRPSLLSIVSNLGQGIGVVFQYSKARSWPGDTPLPANSAYVFPLDVQAYGERALEASMVVVRSESSTHVCAGVVSIAAVHPGDRDIQLQMQMQAVGRLRDDELARVTREEEGQPVSEEFR